MNWLKSFFEETPGSGSMIRAVNWWAFVFLIILPTILWALLSWRACSLVEIPSTVSVFCLTGFGAATGAKVVQSFGEKPPPA